jgi:2-methylcitrate dehydratase PrpD
MTAASALAGYATSFGVKDIPKDVLALAKACLIDTIAAAIYGADAQASRFARQYALTAGMGHSRILGGGPSLRAEAAAFANGVAAHALELDSLRKPGAGVHPGAVLVPAALAVAQEVGASGTDLLAAIVAGCEVMFRIGRATKHSAEARGFHAPGITGPFGAAIAAGRLLGLDAAAMTRALGIAGSLSAGLLAFAASGEGAMVKRLHLGRAAENGIVAARLAAAGFTGPASVLEGRYGVLDAFCPERDDAQLTAGLGEVWETRTICFKRYPCHITAHTPLYAIEQWRPALAEAVERVDVAGTAKMAAMHAGTDPADLVMAQYSIPFCVAVALLRDPRDPGSFSADALADPAIRALARRVRVTDAGEAGWTTTTRLHLAHGRVLERRVSTFPGAPDCPEAPDIAGKFRRLTQRLGPASGTLLGRLQDVEREPSLAWLEGAPS